MDRFQAWARNPVTGAAQPAAAVVVKIAGTEDNATIFADEAGETPKDNPFTADSNGFITFCAEDGRYEVRATTFGITGSIIANLRDGEALEARIDEVESVIEDIEDAIAAGGVTVAVEDEGTPVTAGAASINFTGAAVTATADGAAVTVAISAEAPGTAASAVGDHNENTEAHANLMRLDYNVRVADAEAADFTLAAGHKTKAVPCTKETLQAVTVPKNATVALPVGYATTLYAIGAGGIEVEAEDGDVTIIAPDDKMKSRVTGSPITLLQISANTWLLSGDTKE